MRLAIANRRKGHYFIQTARQTTDGVWILGTPCVALLETSSDTELERAIQAALDASQIGIPHPCNWDEVPDPLLDLAGVKTWSAFVKGASCLHVEGEGERITLVPTRNLGPKEGFEEDLSRKVVLEGGARETLGASVRRLLMQAPAARATR